MIDAYKGEEHKRKEIELNLKRQELEFPEKKRKGSSKPRNIHIVTKPCNHVIQKNSRELIVRQVNETPNDEVNCEIAGQPPPGAHQMAPPTNPTLPIVNPHQIRTMDQFQQQYVLVPVEMMSNVVKVRRSRSKAPRPQRSVSVESVATQTSDRSDDEESHLERKNSEDWLTGFDEKDGERIDVDEEYDEQESERFMRRRREFDEKHGSKKWHTPPPPPPPAEVASDEVRVSIESDAPPSPSEDLDPPTSSGSPGLSENDANPLAGPGVPDPKKTGPGSPGAKKSSGSAPIAPSGAKRSPDKKNPGSDTSGTSGSAPPPPGIGPEDPKASDDPKASKDPKANPNGDKSYVASQYFGQPGENLSALSSNPPAAPKSSSPAARPSIFPYFVDPKAPSPSVSTSKASSKLTDPDPENTESSCAL
ncbi:hypothetical protein CAEBREN_28906 [Caenorhabditis brenneri]|uniref:Uncharacterized protein n=1 Tax=Caenorhabditis brenneri TaxID=135651 RepID=G0P4S1_CAEBE|nr:hypothetical protein CAEBREN_28906 [Caenorhabditis brenneri]